MLEPQLDAEVFLNKAFVWLEKESHGTMYGTNPISRETKKQILQKTQFFSKGYIFGHSKSA